MCLWVREDRWGCINEGWGCWRVKLGFEKRITMPESPNTHEYQTSGTMISEKILIRGLWVLNLNYLNAFLIKGPGLVTIHRCMFCTNSWPARNKKLSVRYEFSRNLLQIIFNFLFDGFMILDDRCLDGGMGGGILHREGRETWGWESFLFPECRAWG